MPRPSISRFCRSFLLLLAGAGLFAAPGLLGQAPARPDLDRHEYLIENFQFEDGKVLPRAVVVYGTYGKLNADRSNAILLPSHYLANHHGYDWLIGKGGALDTTKAFLVMTEMFGNGQSSSPSNTAEPFHGPRFPEATIRDNVEAVRRLLQDGLGVRHLRAIIGFSMGAEQAFQWAVSHPDFADRIVATAGTAKCWPHGIVRLDAEIAAITGDPGFNGGDYTEQPKAGVQQFALIWAGWLFSQEWWRQELWHQMSTPQTTLAEFVTNLTTNFIPGADANDLILQARMWRRHDVGTSPGMNGSLAKALGSIKVPFLYMPSATDMYFPVTDARYEAGLMHTVSLVPIPSLWGHPAGAGLDPKDRRFLNTRIRAFLAGARVVR